MCDFVSVCQTPGCDSCEAGADEGDDMCDEDGCTSGYGFDNDNHICRRAYLTISIPTDLPREQNALLVFGE